jgi:hypothetical protein
MTNRTNQKLGHFIHCSRLRSGLDEESFANRLGIPKEALLGVERGIGVTLAQFALCAILMGFKYEEIGELIARTVE